MAKKKMNVLVALNSYYECMSLLNRSIKIESVIETQKIRVDEVNVPKTTAVKAVNLTALMSDVKASTAIAPELKNEPVYKTVKVYGVRFDFERIVNGVRHQSSGSAIFPMVENPSFENCPIDVTNVVFSKTLQGLGGANVPKELAAQFIFDLMESYFERCVSGKDEIYNEFLKTLDPKSKGKKSKA